MYVVGERVKQENYPTDILYIPNTDLCKHDLAVTLTVISVCFRASLHLIYSISAPKCSALE